MISGSVVAVVLPRGLQGTVSQTDPLIGEVRLDLECPAVDNTVLAIYQLSENGYC